VWTARVDTHPVARVTGAPKLAAGRLFVPMSSLEESGAGNPSYPCCTFRGGVAAYDARTGARLWKNFTVADEPRRTRRTSVGTQLWAPAGAGVWSSPTVDLERRAVYLATGNGYTEPADIASDAVIAYDIDTGKRQRVKQVMANDSYVRDCPGIYRPNVPTDDKSETCPDDLGPDMDFGNSPILRARPGGRTLWQFDTDRDFTTVNGAKADGGGINAAGPVVAGGMLFLTSGYSDLGGGNPGNVLLAFAVTP
jgi:polyvinyl alcohol dehydrogenase (cytochrome)